MENAIKSDFGISVKPNSGVQLPLREGPLRFAVMRKDGMSSNSWRAWVESPGDFYIKCRDNMSEIKISLHKSGKHQIAFTTESKLEMTPGSRFWDRWTEPLYIDRLNLQPTFKLYFPSWGLSLSNEDRLQHPETWDKNEILISTSDKDLMTTVSFYVVDERKKLKNENVLHYVLGIMPTRPEFNLWTITYQEQDHGLRQIVAQALQKIDPNSFPTLKESKGEVLSACLTGLSGSGGAFMIVVPIRVDSKC